MLDGVTPFPAEPALNPLFETIAAHPGWPWTDEMTAVALHKGNVYWELSGSCSAATTRARRANRPSGWIENRIRADSLAPDWYHRSFGIIQI